MASPPVIWIISDGKAGHLAQSEGLVAGVERLAGPFRIQRLTPADAKRVAWRARPPVGERPVVAVGAGSATHGAVLSCRHCLGARAVVLMNPGVWLRPWFDLVVAPEHDGLRERANVAVTRGALTSVRPANRKDPASGLILLGGPSSHHGWSDESAVAQVREVVERTPGVRWTLTTSRRTPPTFLPALASAGIDAARLDVWPVERTTREWLLGRYAASEQIWVSEDSVSMVYEALTSGARVGLLRVPRKQVGRVVRGVDALARDGFATWIDEWRTAGALRASPEPLDEASRIATIVVDRFGLKGGAA